MIQELNCARCNNEFSYERPSGPGRLRRYCSGRCRTPQPRPKRPSLTCSDCGCDMHRGTTSLPQGEATCLACRRRSPKPRRSGRPAPYVPRPPREWDCVVCGLHVTAAARSRGAKLCQAHKWWKPTNCTTCGRRHYSANRSTAGRAVYCSDDCKPVREPRVQCAHHLCNSLKSDRGAGDQLALIG